MGFLILDQWAQKCKLGPSSSKKGEISILFLQKFNSQKDTSKKVSLSIKG